MSRIEKMHEFYEICKEMKSDDFKELVRENIPMEEKGFYMSIHDHFLQKRQEEVMKNEKEYYKSINEAPKQKI